MLTELRQLLRDVSRDLQIQEGEHADPTVAADIMAAEGYVTLACAKLSNAIARKRGQ